MKNNTRIVHIKITGITKSTVHWWRHLRGLVFVAREEPVDKTHVSILEAESIGLLNLVLPRKIAVGFIAKRNYTVTSDPPSSADQIRSKIPRDVYRPPITITEVFAKLRDAAIQKQVYVDNQKKLRAERRKSNRDKTN